MLWTRAAVRRWPEAPGIPSAIRPKGPKPEGELSNRHPGSGKVPLNPLTKNEEKTGMVGPEGLEPPTKAL